MLGDFFEPGYFDLKALAAYSSCSVRWLRDRLHPLPNYRIEGKILVKREEFDHWLASSYVVNSADELSEIVDSVVAHMRPSKRNA